MFVDNFLEGCLFVEKAGKTCGNKLSTKMQNPQVTHSSFRLCGKQDSKVGEFYIDKTLSDSLYYQSMSMRIIIILMEVSLNEKNLSTK